MPNYCRHQACIRWLKRLRTGKIKKSAYPWKTLIYAFCGTVRVSTLWLQKEICQSPAPALGVWFEGLSLEGGRDSIVTSRRDRAVASASKRDEDFRWWMPAGGSLWKNEKYTNALHMSWGVTLPPGSTPNSSLMTFRLSDETDRNQAPASGHSTHVMGSDPPAGLNAQLQSHDIQTLRWNRS
jgi:hypothetical protein